MRRVRYQVAATLDGFIAGPQGEFDWIPTEPEIDFAQIFAEFDVFVIGRRTFQAALEHGGGLELFEGKRIVVASRSLRQADHPAVTVVADDITGVVRLLKAEEGRDIWLFGGGELCRHLLDAGLVDTVEVALVPILLGGGIPIVSPGRRPSSLRLLTSRPLSSGMVMLTYEVVRETPESSVG